MNGLGLLRSPKTTADEIADIVSAQCPPVVPENCDAFSCRECWLAWLTTGEPPKERGRPTNRRPRTRKGCTPTSRNTSAKSGGFGRKRRSCSIGLLIVFPAKDVSGHDCLSALLV